MVPVGRATEFFGFYSVSSKFAGIAGPLVFAVVAQVLGTSRWGILSLVVFFVLGGLILTRVDIKTGRALANETDAAMMARSRSN